MKFIYNSPGELLIVLITMGLLTYFLAEILPKILHSKAKKDMESLNQTSSHDIAEEQGAEAYFDTTFPVVAYETTQDFVSLEGGWRYGEEKKYDFTSAQPEAEEQSVNENATEFEKQGYGRRMMH